MFPTAITVPEIPWVRTPRNLHFFNNCNVTRTDRCIWQVVNAATQIRTRNGVISVPEIARAAGCSERTVYYSLARLRKAGLIEVSRRPGSRNMYRTCNYLTPAKTCSPTPAKYSTTQRDNPFKKETTAAAASVELRSRVPEPVKAAAAPPTLPVVEEPPPPPSPEVVTSLVELGVAEPVAKKEAQRVSAEVALAVLATVVQIVSRGSIKNPAGLALTALRNPKRFMPVMHRQRAVEYPQCGLCGKDITPEYSSIGGYHLGCYHEHLESKARDAT